MKNRVVTKNCKKLQPNAPTSATARKKRHKDDGEFTTRTSAVTSGTHIKHSQDAMQRALVHASRERSVELRVEAREGTST